MVHTWRKQLVTFGMVGAANTGLDVGSYAVLVSTGCPLLLATLLSTSLGLASSYWLNRNLTFHDQASRLPQGSSRTKFLFLVITLAGLWGLQPAIIIGLKHLLGLTSTPQLVAAKLAATTVTLAWNFVWYRRVVFAPPAKAEPPFTVVVAKAGRQS